MPEEQIKILLIEDNDGDAVLLKEMLAEISLKKFLLSRCVSLSDGISFLENNKIDIVLLDLSLPDSSGLTTFTQLHEKFIDLPVILLTGLDDQELALNSVQAGAQSYLVKGGTDSSLLSSSILYSIERSRLLKIVKDELNQRKAVEQVLTKTNRALKVLSECNQIVVRANNENDMLNNLCHILIEIGEFCMVWIVIGEDQLLKGNLRIFKNCSNTPAEIAENINPESVNTWIEKRNEYISPEKILYNNLLWTAEENDFLYDKKNDANFRASASFPLILEDTVIGYLNICSKEQGIFNPEEIKLLSELIDDITLGIQSIRIRKEREKTLKNLKESDERFRFIVEASNNVVYQLDYSTMKYHYLNPAIKRITGYDPDELNAIGFRNIIEKVKNPRFGGQPVEFEELKEKIEKKVIGEWQADYMIRTKEGGIKWLTDHSSPWYDEDGKFIGSIGILGDITERMQAEEEIILAKEQAEEMNRLKTNFLSNMSHELRTPMVGILGYSEIMKNDASDSSTKRMANLIYFSGTRLMETLNIILDLSRLEAGKMDLAQNEFDLIHLVKSITSFYQDQCTQKKLYLKIDTAFNSLYIRTDERMLKNSIDNLINNAVKFTSEGGIKIEIDLVQKPEKSVTIKVMDTGIGISKDDQEIMWEEFRQVSEGFNRTYEGTGLGLTITKKFIQKLGGNISVESKVNEGSAFTIMLPVEFVKVEYSENVASVSGMPIQLLEAVHIKPKILVVDDDETSRNVIIRFLRDKCNVDCAVDGKDSIAKAGSEMYNAVLMDINLGKGMNGLEATRQIRKIAGYETIPIVAVTAYAMKGDKEEFLEAGCTAYISKPFSKLQFIPFIEEILKINL